MAPTSTIETVTVVRPIKIMAFICGILSLLLLIISMSSTNWLYSSGYRQGLWQECKEVVNPDGSTSMPCTKNPKKDWIIACASLVTISMCCVIAGVALNGCGLILKIKQKYLLYRIAMYIFFFSTVALVISLIVFPAMFMQEMESRPEGDDQWYFGWSYGVAWGAAIFKIGAAILLLVDKESDEYYYREKTSYHNDAAAQPF